MGGGGESPEAGRGETDERARARRAALRHGRHRKPRPGGGRIRSAEAAAVAGRGHGHRDAGRALCDACAHRQHLATQAARAVDFRGWIQRLSVVMNDPIWISDAEVVELLDLREAIEALERGLRREAQGDACNMVKTHVAWGHNNLHAIGAVFPGDKLAGTKTWAHTEGGATPLLIL